LTCFLLFWALLYSFFLIKPPLGVAIEADKKVAGRDDPRLPRSRAAYLSEVAKRRATSVVLDRARFGSTSQLDYPDDQPKPHVASLGETLYTDDLITVELVGALLFVALVGALAIAAPKPPIRPGVPAGTRVS
jgi:NADH-quinone oxidoreductase subunit J